MQLRQSKTSTTRPAWLQGGDERWGTINTRSSPPHCDTCHKGLQGQTPRHQHKLVDSLNTGAVSMTWIREQCWASRFTFADYFAVEYRFVEYIFRKQLKGQPRLYDNHKISQAISNLMLNAQKGFSRNNKNDPVIEITVKHMTSKHNRVTKSRKFSVLVRPNKWYFLNKCPVLIPSDIALFMEIGYRFLFTFLDVIRCFSSKYRWNGFRPTMTGFVLQ